MRQAGGTESMSIVGIGQSKNKISFKALRRQTTRAQLVSEIIDLVCHVKFEGRHLHNKNKREMIPRKSRYAEMPFKSAKEIVVGRLEVGEDVTRRNLSRLHSTMCIALFLSRVRKLKLS